MARRSAQDWESIVATALRRAADLFALEESPLADEAYIRDLGRERHPRKALMYGHAVRAALVAAATEGAADMDGRFRAFRVAYASGTPISAAAGQLGMTREHLTRHWRPTAVRLITAQLRATLGPAPIASVADPRAV
jgi:hypothetical protein